jgi:hypothetical protein
MVKNNDDFRNWLQENVNKYPYFRNVKVQYKKQKYVVYLEGWNSICFTEIQNVPYDEIKNYDDHELEDLAINLSYDIMEKERWDGFFYFYNDEIGNSKYSYGVTVFYRAVK